MRQHKEAGKAYPGPAGGRRSRPKPDLPPPWDRDSALAICQAAAGRYLPWFRELPAIGYEDLVSEGMAVSLVRHRYYRPHRGAYAPWLFRAVTNHFKNLHQRAAADKRRERIRGARRGGGAVRAGTCGPVDPAAAVIADVLNSLEGRKRLRTCLKETP